MLHCRLNLAFSRCSQLRGEAHFPRKRYRVKQRLLPPHSKIGSKKQKSSRRGTTYTDNRVGMTRPVAARTREPQVKDPCGKRRLGSRQSRLHQSPMGQSENLHRGPLSLAPLPRTKNCRHSCVLPTRGIGGRSGTSLHTYTARHCGSWHQARFSGGTLHYCSKECW